MPRKLMMLTSLGSVFEYYDFVIYAMMAPLLKTVFFGTSDLGLLGIFLLFAAGYLVRPLGGLLMGYISDTKGRYSTFAWTMLLMAGATFMMGLLPSYDQIGSFAPFALLALRCLQGLSFGAELPNASVLVSDANTPFSESGRTGSPYTHSHSAYRIGLLISSTAAGAILASFTLWILKISFDATDIHSFAWRIPFLAGGVLGIIAWRLRSLMVHPSHTIKDLNQKKHGFFHLMRAYSPPLKTLLSSFTVTLLPTTLIILNLFFPSYIQEHILSAQSNITLADVYLSMTYALIWAAFMGILAGLFCRKYTYRKVQGITLYSAPLSIALVLMLLNQDTLLTMILGLCLYQTYLTFLVVIAFIHLSRVLPNELRGTLTGAIYNLAYTVASLVPATLLYFTSVFQAPWGMLYAIILFLILINILFFHLQKLVAH